jgi:hypothetical protein
MSPVGWRLKGALQKLINRAGARRSGGAEEPPIERGSRGADVGGGKKIKIIFKISISAEYTLTEEI